MSDKPNLVCFYLVKLKNLAVKMLDTTGHQGDKEFLVEVLMLSFLRHEHLVTLFGYCAEGDQRLLVYEYMPFESVEDHIHGNENYTLIH